MKILLVTMEYPPFKGGVGNYYFGLVNNLKNHEVKIFTNQDKGPSSKAKGNKIIYQPFFYKLIWPKWLRLYFELKKYIKKNKVDIIWVGQILPIGTVALMIKKVFKIPYFVSTHGMDILIPQATRRKKKLLRKILLKSEFITANSNFTKQQIEKLNIKSEMIEVVYPCPNASGSELTAEKLKEIRANLKMTDRKIMLTVGRLVERKGHDLVIRAMPHLVELFPELIYVVIGDGPFYDELASLVKKYKMQKHIFFLRRVPDHELPTFYQLADLFVMPAREINGDVEGFGIVYLEAAKFGLPAVAGRSGGVSEAVKNNKSGFLINAKSPLELVDKIQNILEDEKLYKQISKQSKEYAAGFSYSKEANKLSARLKLL